MQRDSYITLTLTLILYYIFPLSSFSLTPSLDPTQCTNYYNTTNIPSVCNSQKNCYLDLGISQLIQNKTTDLSFVICIDLPQYNLYINHGNPNETFMQDVLSVYIHVNLVSMVNQYTLICQQNLVIFVQEYAEFVESMLTGAKIWVQSAENISISASSFVNQSVLQTECSCVTQKKGCNWLFSYPLLFTQDTFNLTVFDESQVTYQKSPQNSITILSQNFIQIQLSRLRYSIIGIFSQQIVLQNSTLTTSGLGYPSDSGPGCGYFDQVLNQLLGCMGSGGSYGGFGGNSSPQNCYLLVSRQPYGNVSYPSQPGSGGGFIFPHSRESSSGGGIINLQASAIYVNSSQILSQGKNGIQGGGGGAGGTISIDYNTALQNIQNILTTNISVNGGNGDKLSSSGAGGRIRLWDHNWKNYIPVTSPNKIIYNISANGGLGCQSTAALTHALSCGEQGSIYTSPCRPGTQISTPSYNCSACLPGYYQMTYGYSTCIACNQKPDNSQWTEFDSIQNVSLYKACSYVCNEGFYNYSGLCLTSSQRFFQKIYGTDLLISLGMIGSAVLIHFLIVFIRNLAQKESILTFDDPGINQIYKKKFFRLQDLPYHQFRLYCSGLNHPFSPWKITLQAEQNFLTQIKFPVTKIKGTLQKIIKQINLKAEYSKWQKFLLIALRYSYYPLSRLVLSSMRKKKAQMIFEDVDKYNKKMTEAQSLGVKFHVKPQHNVASLQVFDYSKSILDFYIENYFPLYFLLEKAPFGGYVIDFTDPFLKVFINEYMQKDSTGKSVQIFLKELNKFMKNQSQIISCLNYMWTMSDINPKFQVFLWQAPNKTIGVTDKQYKIDKKQPLFLVFNSQNSNSNHFILKQPLPQLYLPEIEYLKHKIIIRKDMANQQDGNSIWMIQNSIHERVLVWIFGFFTFVFLLLTLASFFMIILIKKIETDICSSNENTDIFQKFNYGIIIYFAFWPLCDFMASFLNFKTILSKDQYVLADAITFNIITVFKSIILFVCVVIYNTKTDNHCLSANMYIWLVMAVIGIFIFANQVMLRARIIAHVK